jgi:peroxiredoxin
LVLDADMPAMENTMSLQTKLDAVKAQFAIIAPAPLQVIMAEATTDLIASGQAQRALQAGDRAPVFVLPDTEGKPVSSLELLRAGPLVVTFYRGTWCPYCNLDLQSLEEAAPAIRARGATLVAISAQTAVNSRKSRRDSKLSFPILTDQGASIADKFGIRWTLPLRLQEAYQALGVDLPMFNGEDSWTLPMPARYVIGQDGLIAYAEISPDYTLRPEPGEMLPTLDRLRLVATT